MGIKDIKIFKNKNEAQVKCNIYFSMDQPDDEVGKRHSKGPKKANEKIELVKVKGKWRIQKINQFFKFLVDRKNKLMK